jgi:2'-5' RNA ligase
MNIAKTKTEIAAQNAVISAFKAAFAKHMTLASVAAGPIVHARKWYNECNNASEASAQFVREAKATAAADKDGRD